MHLSRATGWFPWIPYDSRDLAQSPYGYLQVELGREEWGSPQIVDPRALDPMTNVVDLWWRPVSPAVYVPGPLADTASPITYAQAQALCVADGTRTPAQRAYAVWYLHTYPRAPHTPAYAWQLLGPNTRALWEHIAQAVLHTADDQR